MSRFVARFIVISATALVLATAGATYAATVTVRVAGDGAPLANAIVSLENPDGTPIPPPPGTQLQGVMDQRNREFAPHILAVEAGTVVRFPNSDDVRHDVYSFSPARTFELPLYADEPAHPVRFDTPGVVVIGCNIHDWMLGFIRVVPTPYFARTGADGVAELSQIPAGRYELVLWHPRIAAPGHSVRKIVALKAGDTVRQEFDVALGTARKHAHKPSTEASAVIRQLRQKFMRFRELPSPPAR